MDKIIDFKYSSIVINKEGDSALATEGYITFPFLKESDIKKLQVYYEQFQKEELTHFYSSTHSPDFEFRKLTSDFIKSVIEPLLPDVLKDYKLLGGAFVVKPANGKGILQPHQDWNLVDESKGRSYNLWIPLVDVTVENGAVFVLPKSHSKIKTYRGPGVESIFTNIEQEVWGDLKPLPMKAGEALLYDHALLHGSPPNRTSTYRLGVVLGVVNKNVELQLIGKNKGIMKSYICDENFFLSKNTETDFVQLPVNSDLLLQQRELTLNEFSEIFLNVTTKNFSTNAPNVNSTDNRTFFEKYTLKNILAEVNYRLSSKKTSSLSNEKLNTEASAKRDVAKFYNEQTDNFLKVYGNVIQAFRTKNVSTLLNYQINAIGLKSGIKVLDAGCGVCGPAVYFAENAGCSIDAITISEVQVEKAKQNIQQSAASSLVKVVEGDYHLLEKFYPENNFDIIYFLESFGHAHDHFKVLDSAWKVLKPGGTIYIKDLFIKKALHKGMELGIKREIDNINNAYHYNVPDLNAIIDYVRKKGYILSSLKTIDIPLEEFENLTISNDFQELTGINKIDNLREYVFPVDFFELKLIKPTIDVAAGNSRYFLQNMYFMQIENWKESDI